MENRLEALAVNLGRRLSHHSLIMATAESCTGGWVAKLLTDIAGSSDWFDCGFVTYSNQAKQRMLGVSAETLEAQGAVSEAVVMEMATGALARSRAEVAVAISGIAGPGGGSKEKPVGTVWFAWQRSGHACVARQRVFKGNRNDVRQQASLEAMQGMLELIKEP